MRANQKEDLVKQQLQGFIMTKKKIHVIQPFLGQKFKQDMFFIRKMSTIDDLNQNSKI